MELTATAKATELREKKETVTETETRDGKRQARGEGGRGAF